MKKGLLLDFYRALLFCKLLSVNPYRMGRLFVNSLLFLKRPLTGLLLFLSLTSSLHAVNALVINVDYTETSFQIMLPANPGAGIQWVIQSYDRSFLQLVSVHFVPRKPFAMGSFGEMVYYFTLMPNIKAPPMTTMVFLYFQPWEPEVSMKTVTINFNKAPPKE